jgi:hypothetical protein
VTPTISLGQLRRLIIGIYFNPFESVQPDYNFYRLTGFLEDTIFPIETSFGNDEPRFLMVGVDVQDCTTSTTFDSYPKEKDQNGNCIWYSEHGVDTQTFVDNDGTGVKEALTSRLFAYTLQHTRLPNGISNTDRSFWDGNFISSTAIIQML